MKNGNGLLWRLVIAFASVSVFLMLFVFVVLNLQVQNVYYQNFASSVQRDFNLWKSYLPGKLTPDIIYDEFEMNRNHIFFFRVNEYLSITVMDVKDREIYYSSDARFSSAAGKELLSLQLLSSPNVVSLLSDKETENTAKLLNINNRKYFDYAIEYDGYLFYFMYDREDWKGILNSFGEIIYGIAFMSGIISLVLGFILSGTIIKPIRTLMKKAEDIATGNFDTEIPVKSDDEIGRLTHTFNVMGQAIKKNLNEIAGERNKFETIINYMNDGILAFNRQGELIQVNPAALSLLRVESLQCNFAEFCSDYMLDVHIEDLLKKDKPVENDKYIYLDQIRIHVFFAGFQNQQNQTEGVLTVLQDITEQSRLDEMRKEFVANVSHELRTPLTSIKLYSETLMDDPSNLENNINFLSVINTEADRMKRLADDLLQLSRVDRNIQSWNFTEMQPHRILKDVVDKMQMEAVSKRQTMEYEEKGHIPEIKGDIDRLQQVFINIINNAIKYTPENGTIKVSISTEDAYIVIVVEDNGIGIKSEDQKRLFERFYRVDKARSRDMGGTGLGLSIAKEIVKAHKGEILLKSEHGKGTEIKILLPAKV